MLTWQTILICRKEVRNEKRKTETGKWKGKQELKCENHQPSTIKIQKLYLVSYFCVL